MADTKFSSNLYRADGESVADWLAARYPEQINTLLAWLRTGVSGQLAVAKCDDLELRRRLFAFFKDRLAAEDIYLFPYEVPKQDVNLVRALRDFIESPRFKTLESSGKFKSIVIFVYGIEKYDPAQEARFLYLLNFLSEAFENTQQPVVIWGTSPLMARLARSAPDFWSRKGIEFAFPSPGAKTRAAREVPRETPSPPAGAPPLVRYLQAVLEDPDYAVWRDLYLPLKAVRAADALQQAPPRHTLTEDEMAQVQEAFTQAEVHATGETIFERGDPGETCYLIVTGEVEVLAPDALGNEVAVTRLGPGDFFGEIALLQSVPRTATVRTMQPSRFLVLDRRLLGTVARVAPSVAEMLKVISRRRLESRMRDSQELVSPLRRFALEGHSLIRQTPVEVRQLVADDQCVVILGEAGAGKTTVLRRMMLDLASEGRQALALPVPIPPVPAAPFRALGTLPRGPGEAGTLPFPIPETGAGSGTVAGRRAAIPFFLKLNMLSPERQPEELVLEALRGYGLQEFQSREDVAALLKGDAAHSCVFLMDGLNEMSGQAGVRQDLNRFVQENAHSRFVMGCRVQDYVPIARFRTAMLQRLAGGDVESFLARYLGAERGRRVAREISSDPQLEDLAQTPLALFMFAHIAKSSQAALPKNRGVLFESFTNHLLERSDAQWSEAAARPQSRVPLTIRRAALASLGLTMQDNQVWALPQYRWLEIVGNELFLYQEAATRQEQRAVRALSAEEVVRDIVRSGLLRYAGDRDWVEFAHHTLQEFFAALALREQSVDLEPLLRSPESRRQWMGTIVLLYGISRYKARLFFQILGHGDDYSRIWLAAECLANAGGDIAYVAEDLESVMPRGSSFEDWQRFGTLFSVGLALRQLGRYPEALTYLHRAAELQPGSPDVQYELGSLYRLVDQYERAITHLEEAIRARSDFVDAYNQLGITYYDQGKHVEALTVFRATTQLEPSNPHHYYNLGTVLKLLRDYPAAISAFHKAVELKADYNEARTQLDILEKAMVSGAIRVLDRIPLLNKLSLEQNVLLANRLRVFEYQPGEIVFHMGELGDSFYIVESGEVEVLAPDVKGAPGVLDRLGPGEFFGEIALLRAVPRTATIRVVSPTRLLALSREDFNDVLARYPSVAHRLAETSGVRLLRDRQRGRTAEPGRAYDSAYIEELAQHEEVTVVMGDIHGSTLLTQAIGGELMVEFLDEYLKNMSTVIVQAGGALDRSLGDSVMGVFGSFYERHGESGTTSGARALLAALRMRQAYLDLRARWSRKRPQFAQTGMGIGLSTGSVAKGTVGSETAMVGSAVNLSNKLSKLAIKGRQESEIYVDERTNEMLGDSVIAELLDPVYTSRKAGGVLLRAYRIVQRRE